MRMMPMVQIRTLTVDDLPSALKLSMIANWNQTLWDWALIQGLEGFHFAAEIKGQLVGTIAAIDYGQFYWIAMVLVHPDFRRQGIATLLLDQVLELDPDHIYRLDATAAGAAVYSKLGFVEMAKINRWHRPKGEIHAVGKIKSSSGSHLKIILKKDLDIFGGDRSILLTALSRNYPDLCQSLLDNHSVEYAFGRVGTNAWQIGPLVAENYLQARILLADILSLYPDQAFYLDSFIHKEWEDELQKLGFKKDRMLLRMQKNSQEVFGKQELQFAIAGPELG